MNKTPVLITGATGFLGRHLTLDLLAKGADVTVLARKTSDFTFLGNQKVKVIYGDITDRLSVLRACEDQSIVYHLAGFIAYKRADREKMEQINVKGTAHIIDACLTAKVDKLLHLSSVVTIGANFKPQPVDEDFHFNLSKYNIGYFETKRKAEKMVMDAYKNDGLLGYLINPSTIYGAGDATKGSRKTQIKVAKGQFKFFPPGGVNVVYAQDVIQAIHLCLNRGRPARRYIISGENLTIKQLFEKISLAAGVPAPWIPIPKFLLASMGMLGDILRRFGFETSLSSETAVTASLYHWFNNKRARQELGFKPTSADKAIKESVLWMKENGLIGPILKR